MDQSNRVLVVPTNRIASRHGTRLGLVDRHSHGNSSDVLGTLAELYCSTVQIVIGVRPHFFDENPHSKTTR
jgi:hypothetical protein